EAMQTMIGSLEKRIVARHRADPDSQRLKTIPGWAAQPTSIGSQAYGRPSMELGIYHEFPVLPGRSQAECFAAGFDIVDVSEEYGLDVMWLAELHFDKRRALAASPLVLGTAIAAPPRRNRIGASRQVPSLAKP